MVREISLNKGDHIGPYELSELLGAGGMGVVWRARDPRLGRDVAIKVLARGKASDPGRLRRFELEARATGSLNHPNILTIFDIGTHQNTPFIVAELLEGSTLHEAEVRERLSLEQVIDYAHQIAKGLAAAHQRGIVHRDLKPDNIFVTTDGRVKILDFGLARLSEETSVDSLADADTATQVTRLGSVLGTVGYMSPEQVLGRTAEPPADVFAFGCLLFEMMTGVQPFSRETQIETMTAILRADPPELPEIDARVPAGLERIRQRCLVKEPEGRYPSGTELAADLADLNRALSTGEIQIEGSVWAARARVFVRRRWRWLAAAGAAILAAGLGLWLYSSVAAGRDWTALGGRAIAGRAATDSVAVLPFRNVSADPKLEYLCDGITEELINNLGRVEGLRVAGRTSSFRFKGGDVDLAQVRALLKVSSVLEGSVQPIGGLLRIRAQLVSLPDGFQLWSDKYDRESVDVHAVQEEVATAIVAQLLGEIAAAAFDDSARREDVDFATYELYLQGRYHLNKRTEPDMKRALEYFRKALDRDPDFARGWSGLADAYMMHLSYALLSPEEAGPKAETAARHALALDPALADGHTSLAAILQETGRIDEAEREYRLALKMEPGHLNANLWLGQLLVTQGRSDEAMPYVERAIEVDPLLPAAQRNRVQALYMVRRFEEAIALAEDGVENAGIDSELLDWHLALLYAKWGGRPEEALTLGDKWLARTVDEPVLHAQWQLMRAIALFHAGREAEARELIYRITEEQAAAASTQGVSDVLALAHATLGDAGSFVRWARETLDYYPSEFSVGNLERSPEWDLIRADPRFVEFVEWRRSAND